MIFWKWIILGLVCVFSLGPGYLLYATLFREKNHPDFLESAALITGLSISVWAIVLSLLQILDISISKWAVILGFSLCWLASLWVARPWKIQGLSKESLPVAILCLVILSTIVFYALMNRNMVAGLGSDSYHHTLIVQMILDNHGLPENYHNYAPIATFTYHFGYHAFTALIAGVSDIEARLMVLISGALIMGLCALTVACLTRRISSNPWSGVIAAAITGFACVFPGYMLTWGRYTQILGLCLSGILLCHLIDWINNGYSHRKSIVIGILATGLFLTHYRVMMMTIAAAMIIIAYAWIKDHQNSKVVKDILKQSLVVVGITLILSLPWLIHLILSRSAGFSIPREAASATYFSLSRLGPEVLDFPTNKIIMALAGIGIAWAIYRRNQIAICLVIWGVVLMLIAQPWLGAEVLDTITVIISIFLPGIALISWMLPDLLTVIKLKSAWRTILLSLLMLSICFSGMLAMPPSFSTDMVYLTPDDLIAFKWIRQNTPEDALFMVNTFNFDFLKTYIIGSDGGYWLPLLTARASVVPPMNYSTERWDDVAFIDRLVGLHALNGHLASPQATQILCDDGITHIFIGGHGGMINPAELDSSSFFTLLFSHGNSRVYHFEGSLCVSE